MIIKQEVRVKAIINHLDFSQSFLISVNFNFRLNFKQELNYSKHFMVFPFSRIKFIHLANILLLYLNYCKQLSMLLHILALKIPSKLNFVKQNRNLIFRLHFMEPML